MDDEYVTREEYDELLERFELLVKKHNTLKDKAYDAFNAIQVRIDKLEDRFNEHTRND